MENLVHLPCRGIIMPVYDRVRLTRGVERAVSGLHALEVAVVLAVLEDDIDSPVRSLQGVREAPNASDFLAFFPIGKNKRKEWLTHKIVNFKG